MTDQEHSLFQYNIDSQSYLCRGRDHLEHFDTGEVPSLFYAALELRMGIEARIREYLDATIKSRSKSYPKIKDHAATKLLNRLKEIEPDAENWAIVTFTMGKTGPQSKLVYTPVTQKLAKMHGRIGELLHFNVFKNSPDWFYNQRLNDIGSRSLLDIRDYLVNVADELKQANRGTLLIHPIFTKIVDAVVRND